MTNQMSDSRHPEVKQELMDRQIELLASWWQVAEGRAAWAQSGGSGGLEKM